MSLWKIFGRKDDDIPEVKLPKKEPKAYFDKKNNVWMIEGEEEAILQQLQKKNAVPPKSKDDSKSEGIRTQSGGGKKVIMARYANIFGNENIMDTRSEQPKLDDNISEIVADPLRHDDGTSNSIIYNPQIQSTKVFKPVNMNLNANEDLPLAKNETHNMNISEVEEKIKSKLEREFASKLIQIESNYTMQISELKESLQFYEENYEDVTNVLKGQINNFIKENLELKMELDKTKDELAFKQKEIAEYQNLLANYRNTIEETNKNLSMHFHNGTDLDISPNEDYIIISSRVEKLEYEKIILTNDLIESKVLNDNLKLDKQFLEYKISELENQNIANLEKMKEKCITLERKLADLEGKHKILSKSKEQLEKESKNIEELSRHNENLKLQLVENNNEISRMKLLNDTLSNDIKSLKQTNAQMKSDLAKSKSNLEEKDANYTKVISDLRERIAKSIHEIEELKKKNDEIQMSDLKHYEQKYLDLNENFQSQELQLQQTLDGVERVCQFISTCIADHPEIVDKNIQKTIQSHSETLIDNFDSKICLMFKNFLNEILSKKYEKALTDKEIQLLNEENQNLKIEVEILKDAANEKGNELNYLAEMHADIEANYQNNLKEREESCENLSKELNMMKNENEKLKGRMNNINTHLKTSIDEAFQAKEKLFKISFEKEKLENSLREKEDFLNYVGSTLDTLQEQDILTQEDIQMYQSISSQSSNLFESVISNKIKFFLNLLMGMKGKTNLLEKQLEVHSDQNQRHIQITLMLEDEIKTLRARIEMLNNNHIHLKEEKEGLLGKKRSLENQLAELEKKMLAYPVIEKENIEFKEKMSELIALLQNERIEYEAEISKIKIKFDDSEQNNKQLTVKIQELMNLANETKNQYDADYQEYQRKTSELEQLKGQVTQMTQLITTNKAMHEDETNKLNSNINGLMSENNSMQGKINELMNLLSISKKEHEDDVKKLQNSLKDLETENIQRKNQIEEMMNLLNIVKSEYDTETENMEATKMKFTEELRTLEKENIELKNRIKEYKSEKDSITVKCNHILNDNEIIKKELEGKLKRSEDECSKANNMMKLKIQEQNILMEKLTEKEKELNDVRNKMTDIELQYEKTKQSLDEANKNYQFLLINSKSAEKLNEYNKKIQHLIEEKAVLAQSHNLTVTTLANENRELNAKLNQLLNKEMDQISASEKKLQGEFQVISPVPSREVISVEDPVVQKTISEGGESEKKTEFGFFGKYLAPLFLTEKDLEAIHK